MNAAVSMLLFVMLFATFVTLAGLKRYMTPSTCYGSGKATAMTKAFWRRPFWRPSATVRAWWLSVWTRKGSATSIRKSMSGASGIPSKQPNRGHSVKCV